MRTALHLSILLVGLWLSPNPCAPATGLILAMEPTGLDAPITATLEKTPLCEALGFLSTLMKTRPTPDPLVYEIYFSTSFRELSRYEEKHLFSQKYEKTPARMILADLLKPFGMAIRQQGATLLLTYTPDKKAALIKAARKDLATGDSEARTAGIRLLALSDVRECVPAFVENLGQEDWSVGNAALWALVRMKEREALLKALRQGSWPAKSRAAEGLGLLNQRAAVPEMARLLDQATDQDGIERIVKGLIRCDAAAPVLKALGNPAQQDGTLRALKDLPMEQAATELAEIAKTAEEPLYRMRAVCSLTKLKSDAATAAAVAACSDPSPAVRAVTVNLLTNKEGPGVAQALCRALTDEDARVREAAKDALSDRSVPDAIPHLQTLIDKNPNAASVAKELLNLTKVRIDGNGKP